MRNRLVGALVILSLAAALSGATGVARRQADRGRARGAGPRRRRSTSPRAGCSPRCTARHSKRTACASAAALDLGPREFVAPALANGLIEFLPEYAGTALQFVSLDADAPEGDVEATHRALADELKARHVTALEAAPAQDANAFVVKRETAGALWVASAQRSRRRRAELTFGGPPESASRPLCLGGLKDVYGLDSPSSCRSTPAVR